MFSSFNFKFKQLVSVLNHFKADGLILVSSSNRFWIDELINSDGGFYLVTKKQLFIFQPGFDFDYFQRHLKNNQVKVIKLTSLTDIAKLINQLKLKKVLIEDRINLSQFNAFSQIVKLTPVNLDQLRIIKTPQELKWLTQSAKITCQVLNELRKKQLKTGISEIQLKNWILNRMLELGATHASFDLIVAFGTNTANPHHIATNKKLIKETLIKIDIGCVYQGYCSDLTRTFYFGSKPKQAYVDMFNLVKKAQAIGLKHAKAGIKCCELDKLVRNFITQDPKYGQYFIHGLGHGVGIAIHEPPMVNTSSQTILEPNHVITIEPGVYVKNLGGVRIEDTIVITKNGIKNLSTSCPKTFFA